MSIKKYIVCAVYRLSMNLVKYVFQLISYILMTSGYHHSLRIYHGVDKFTRQWRMIVTNPTDDRLVTRMRGKIRVHTIGENWRNNTEMNIPLGGFVLEPKKSCMTHLPLPKYDHPVIITCSVEFPDIAYNENRFFEDSITYHYPHQKN